MIISESYNSQKATLPTSYKSSLSEDNVLKFMSFQELKSNHSGRVIVNVAIKLCGWLSMLR